MSLKAAKFFLLGVVLYVPTVLVFYLAWTTEYTPLKEFTVARFIILLLFVPIIGKYLIQLFVAPFYSAVEYRRKRRQIGKELPSVSVVIPAWNEEVGVLRTIKSVLETHYPRLQVIVVNDGSVDRTDEIVRSFVAAYEKSGDAHAAELIYIAKKNEGKAKALNVALGVAKGEILVTIDADSIMDTRAIVNLVKHFSDHRVASVAGNVAIGNRTAFIGLIQQLEYLYGFYFKRADSLFNAVYIVGGAAAAYKTALLREVGGFDERIITEDIEISTRFQNLGYHVRYAADAVVYTEGPSDFSGLCKQRLRWKLGRLLTFWKYRNLFFSLKQSHKLYLSFLVLPVTLFAEVLLFFEGVLLTVFYTYTFYTNDFMPLAFVVTLLTGVVVLQVISEPNIKHHRNLLLYAPTAWIVFYIMDIVEYQALVRSIRNILSGTELKWQRWNRVGVFNNVS